LGSVRTQWGSKLTALPDPLAGFGEGWGKDKGGMRPGEE